MNSLDFQKSELERLIRVSKEIGFLAEYNHLKITEDNPYAARVLAYALIDPKYVDYNLKMGLLPEIVHNPRVFYNRYCKTKKKMNRIIL